MSKRYGFTKFSCYIGLVVQAIVNNFLPILFIALQENYGLSYEQLGRIILINFGTQIFADFMSPKLANRFGYKITAFLCQFLAALGLSSLAVLPLIIKNTYIAIIIPVIIYAFGSGIMEVILSPMVELLPSKNKGAGMAFLHSFYCWGQAFTVIGTTALVKIFGYGNWNFIPLVWAVIPFLNMFSFFAVPIIEPTEDDKKAKISFLLKDKTFICFMIFMVCAGASEITMAEWASLFAQRALGISKVAGDLLGPCAFAIFMGSGRIIFGALSGKISVRKVFIINNILCAICYLLVAFCNISVAALIACALCGFSVSLSWPGTYSMATAHFHTAGTAMFSVLALCGDFGCSFGPWLLGFVADLTGLHSGFAVSAFFPLIMIVTALFFLKEKDCKIS
ncbi:MAG: MFS transporter [Clostridia bacterium]|nr:MFS transporter [Clostridia bacterium]